MSKDYKDRVTPREPKTGIYSGLLWFLSGTALGGLLIGAGVMWLKLGPVPLPSVEEMPTLSKTKTESSPPKADAAPTTPKTSENTSSSAPKLEFEYDKILRDTQVTLPDPNQDAQIKITQPPPPKEPSPIADTVPSVPDTQPQIPVITNTSPVVEDVPTTKVLTKSKTSTKRLATAKKIGTISYSTAKIASKKLTVKSDTKTTTIAKTANKKASKSITNTFDTRVAVKPKLKTQPIAENKPKIKQPVIATQENKTPPTKSVTTKSVTTKSASSVITPPAKKKTGVVQLGAFQNEEDVKKLKARMALMGIETTVEKVTTKNNKTVQRVRTTPYSNQRDLDEAKKLFTKHNIKTFVVQ